MFMRRVLNQILEVLFLFALIAGLYVMTHGWWLVR